jgi:hypothetical protein
MSRAIDDTFTLRLLKWREIACSGTERTSVAGDNNCNRQTGPALYVVRICSSTCVSPVRAYLPGLPVLVAEVVDLAGWSGIGWLYVVSSVRSGCLSFRGRMCVRFWLGT